MGLFLQFTKSSIGKKFIMGITGSFLIVFLIVHLIGNLTLFFGADTFNSYVKTLDVVKPLIRVIELVLLMAFILHIYNGIRLWLENRKAKPVTYKVNAAAENSSIFSRTMVHTGSIVFIFLVLHLGTFFYRFNFYDPEGLANQHRYFDIVVSFLQMPVYSLFYVVAVILLGFHLNHGFQSAFQTFGWTDKRYTPIVKSLGTLHAIIMTVGFASMPVYFLFFYGGK
ncbi:MAG TPA: succinate dehydrogenase cytochrome b subunit [Ignavibacteriaceae bacterium]|nr:succinate dehydrogenase cytochrome b subunit [Ignavibacteriaceae bacterium]